MKTKYYWLALVTCAVFSVSSAYGQSSAWYVAPSIVFTDDDDKREVDDGFNGLQVSVGRALTPHISVEGLLGYHSLSGWNTPGDLPSPDQDLLDISANLLFFPNRDSRVSPYFLVGLGYLSADLDQIGSDSNASGSLGVGFNWRMGESKFSIRSEARARFVSGSSANQYGDENTMTDFLYSIGLQYNFGAGEASPAGSTASSTGMDDWYISGSAFYFDDDPHRAVGDGFGGADVRMGLDFTEYLSFEGMFGYASLDGYQDINVSFSDQSHLDVSANLLFFPWRDWTVSPYLLVGLGYLNVDLNPGDSDSGLSGTLGLGFKWKLGDGDWSIRGEARARTVQDSTANRFGDERNLTDYMVSVGVQYNFGKTSAMAAPQGPADTDLDGVLDMWDECPDTPRGTQVSSSGCPLLDRDGDADGDRVPDNIDECPNSPVGSAVNRVGCELDSDGDGVPTGSDRCPSSRPGADVDMYGCENDRDSDGVIDHRDSCPNTRPGVRVDIYGCELSDIIQLPGANFEVGQDLLLGGTEHVLQNAAATLNKYPELRIEVAGHTDDVGNGLANFNLSERRAITVRDFLIGYGVAEDRIVAVGYGESQPIADNSTPEGRATNRRVELRIVN